MQPLYQQNPPLPPQPMVDSPYRIPQPPPPPASANARLLRTTLVVVLTLLILIIAFQVVGLATANALRSLPSPHVATPALFPTSTP